MRVRITVNARGIGFIFANYPFSIEGLLPLHEFTVLERPDSPYEAVVNRHSWSKGIPPTAPIALTV